MRHKIPDPKEITWDHVADWYGNHGFLDAEAAMEEIQQTFRGNAAVCMRAIEMAAYVDMPAIKKAVAEKKGPKVSELLVIW